MPNATKCVWVPVQMLEFLGVMLDSLRGVIYIPNRRLDKALNTIVEIISVMKVHRNVKVIKVASIVGQIISMSVVIGHISQIMTRYLSADVLEAKHWEQYIQISEESMKQLVFWKDNIKLINSKDIFESQKCTKIVFSDASSTGYAGYEVSTVNGVSHGMWAENEAVKSSTWRELVAVYRVLSSLVHILANQRVKWYTDNQGVKSIVSKGSMKIDLQNVAYDIFKLCMRKSISLEMEWIPRSENERADYASKIVDYDDWGISDEIFNLIQEKFGALQTDWFASEYNAKLKRFYSRFWNPSCTGVDAFSENWGNEYGLFVPPITIIHRVIKKMIVDRACGVLVIPCWKSAVFWPFICPNGSFINQVEEWCDLPVQKEYYVRCRNGKGIFGNSNLHFRMIALKMNGRI